MKKYQTIFWVTGTLIFLTQGLMPLLTMNSEGSKAAMAQLGYPAYFGIMLAVFKFLGGLALIVPQVPARVKEWAFAGFAIDFICAFVSFWVISGPTAFLAFPLIALTILMVCYYAHYKITHVQES